MSFLLIDPSELINWIGGFVGILGSIGLGRIFWNRRRKKRFELEEELKVQTAKLEYESEQKKRVLEQYEQLQSHIEQITAKMIQMNSEAVSNLDEQLERKMELNELKLQLSKIRKICINECYGE